MLLKGTVALITGGSRGMGREMAIAFARAGARVGIIAGAAVDETRAEIDDELASVQSEIDRAGGEALALQADVTRWEDCRLAVTRTVERFGALHVLVNNAGKSQRYHGRDLPFWETDHEGWIEIIATNTIGPYLMAKAAVPHMLAAGWGRVINVSKHPDQMHEPHAGAYGPSKAALEAQSLSWAEELASSNVTVNVLDPGGRINTRFGRANGLGLEPTIIVPAALWLASAASDGVTGCRFDAKRWDADRPYAEAAEGCREGPIFPLPTTRISRLDRAWRPATPYVDRLPVT